MISESRLFSTILQVAEDENKYLFDHFRKGIFFMPELAFSYQCGKAVMEDKTSILGNSEYSWVREKEYKDYGFAASLSKPFTIQEIGNLLKELVK